MNAAYMIVPAKVLATELHIPDGHEITGAEWDFTTNSVRLYLHGPGLPDTLEGCPLQRVTLEVTTDTICVEKVVHSRFR